MCPQGNVRMSRVKSLTSFFLQLGSPHLWVFAVITIAIILLTRIPVMFTRMIITIMRALLLGPLIFVKLPTERRGYSSFYLEAQDSYNQTITVFISHL